MTRDNLRMVLIPCAVAAATSCAPPGEDGTAAGPERTSQPVKGTVTPAADKPGIGFVFFATNGGRNGTGSLISPRHVLTAAHSNLTDILTAGTNTFTPMGQAPIPISRIYVFGPDAPPRNPPTVPLNVDVALLELANPAPAGVDPLMLATAPPPQHRPVTMYGQGAGDNACSGPRGTRRHRTFDYGDFTDFGCGGDSGGPAVYGFHTENGAIWGVNSFQSGNGYIWGDVSRYKEDILAVIRMWNANDAGGITGLEPGIHRRGVTLQGFVTTSLERCKELCDTNANCNSFSHDTGRSFCQLYQSAGDWVPEPGFTSGLSSTNRFEVDVDRPGQDYKNYLASLSTCSLDCSHDKRCAAFSWVASQGRCWLKEYVPLSTFVPGVTSGVKRRSFEYFTDRPGNDIPGADVDIPLPTVPDVRHCQSLCSAHPSCVFYTYRNPVYQANPPMQVAPPHCWLKTGTAAPVTLVSDPPGGLKRLISGFWKSTP